ncbi:MAG: PilZ domain-containing protein [Myxococcaceae bacterium]
MAIESRRHGRLELELRCHLASETDSTEGSIANLAMGGAMVRAPRGFAKIGDSVGIEIQRPEPDRALLMMADVVRVVEADGVAEYGLQFQPGPPSLEEELAALVTQLASTPNAEGEPKKVHRRIEVQCSAQEQFRATMVDVSSGGLALLSSVECALGETLEIAIGFQGLEQTIELPGEVIACEPYEGGAYRVEVRFAPLDPALDGKIERLIRALLGVNKSRPKR